jgi:hypothetical protein
MMSDPVLVEWFSEDLTMRPLDGVLDFAVWKGGSSYGKR